MFRHFEWIHTPPAWTTAIFVLVLTTPAAHAKLPSQANSTIPRCIMTTPSGVFVATFDFRDANNNPMPEVTLVLDYEGCDSFVLCAPAPDDSVSLAERTITTESDLHGRVRVRLRAGGGGADRGFHVLANGMSFGIIPIAPADRNGDLVVDGADLAMLEARIGEADPSADLNGDGAVDAADATLLQSQFGATCDAQTPARTSTWGTLKAFYR